VSPQNRSDYWSPLRETERWKLSYFKLDLDDFAEFSDADYRIASRSLQVGNEFWRDVPLASVSDRILPVIYEHEFVPVTTKEQPTYRQAVIDGNFLVERPKFPCPRCPSVFSHKNNLYYHSKFECGQSPRFNCPYCVYRTKHVSNVRAHVRRKHPGNKVYAIDVCKVGS